MRKRRPSEPTTGSLTPSAAWPGVAARLALSLSVAAILLLFAVNVRGSYFLCDDSFISFRYAAHLADGEGLTWNPGERVEGYTNFLWVLAMAAVIRLGAAPELVSNLIGIASGAALLVALLVFSARRHGWGSPAILFAPLALAVNPSFGAWSTSGMETMFFTLVVFLGFAVFLEESRRGPRWPVGSSLLFAVATLTRPEGGLFFVIAGIVLLFDLSRRRRDLRAVLVWALSYAAPVGAHLLWRHAYYGMWLPNTFHAKVAGAWWEQGLAYFSLFFGDYRIVWFLPFCVAALWLRRGRAGRLFAGVVVVYSIYVAYIGGDRLEFRFLVVVMPYFYWLVGEGLVGLARLPLSSPAGRRLTRAGLSAIAAGLLLLTWHGPQRADQQAARHGVAGLGVIRDYAERRIEEGRFLRGLIDEGRLPEDMVLAVGGAGAVPYYTDWPTVDRRGLNDLEIAAQPQGERGVVAHERDATHEYLTRRRVAVFDVFNRLVHDSDFTLERGDWIEHDGHRLPLKTIRVGDRYLIFATLLPDEQLRELVGDLEP
jgi:hypothetical protein